MNKTIEINYRDNDDLRASFNELAVKVFDLNFEGWYQNGFWKDNYIPYSVVIDGKVVSNVSVNRCDVNYDGKTYRLIQLGTVMTDPDYRGKGYAREIMERIMSDYEDKVDGMYLFANDSVVDFYPKFGYKKGTEYQYCKDVSVSCTRSVISVPMSDKTAWDKMTSVLNERNQNSKMYMVNNSGLYMFYLSQFMQESVYYLSAHDTYVIAEEDGDTLIIHAVIGCAGIDEVIRAFGENAKKAVLCFTPKDPSGFEVSELHEEDTTLFVKGRFFDETADDRFMFQSVTHA